MSDMADRVSVAKEIGLHPQLGPWDITEGEHYEVIAYTDWADMFVPTIIEWADGTQDDLTDARQTRQHKQRILEAEANV